MTLIFENREKQRGTLERATLNFRKIIKVTKVTLLLVYESKWTSATEKQAKVCLRHCLPIKINL